MVDCRDAICYFVLAMARWRGARKEERKGNNAPEFRKGKEIKNLGFKLI